MGVGMFRRQRALAAKAVPVVVIESTKVEPIDMAPALSAVVELPVTVAAEPEKVLVVQSQSHFNHQRNNQRRR